MSQQNLISKVIGFIIDGNENMKSFIFSKKVISSEPIKKDKRIYANLSISRGIPSASH